MARLAFVALALLGSSLLATPARAQTTLRIASIIPEGTGWARELRAFAREIESGTHGNVKVKLLLSGVAGDELEVADRIRRNQLDGIVSGGMLCQRLAPSLRVTRIPGLFLEREEAAAVAARLRSVLDKEFLENGFVNFGETVIGPAIPFTRQPVRTLEDLKKGRYWIWDVDDATRVELTALGMQVVPMPINLAARGYDEGKHDGFITPPTAALGFQWSTQARYFTPLPMHYVIGCLTIANRAYDALPQADREIVRGAAAKAKARIEEMGRTMDEQLLGSLFARQGLQPVPVSSALRSDFLELTRALRERSGAQVVSRELLGRVLGILADVRAASTDRQTP